MDKQATKRSLPHLSDRALHTAASGSVWALIAFLLGQAGLPFDIYPLGVSLLCAARTRIGWMLPGLCAAAFAAQTGSPWPRLIAPFFAVGVRILVRLIIDPPLREETVPLGERMRALATASGRAALFGESLMLRMTTACASAFFMSVWAMAAGDFRYDDLFGGFLSMTVAPLFCLGIAPFFDDEAHRGPTLRWEIGAGLILTALCYAMRETDLFGISISAGLAFVLTLLITRQLGIGRGAAIGVACGLCVGPLYAPLFAISAGISGLLWPRSATAAVTVSALFGLLWGGYVDGLSALVRLVPALCCGSIFLLSADRLGLLPEEGGRMAAPGLRRERRSDNTSAIIAAERAESAEARLAALSDTFSALSQVCYNLSDRLRRPGVIELRQICDEACDRFCGSCPHRDLCWEQEYGSTVDMLGKLTIELHGAGKASEASVPDHLRQRCPSMAAILEEINHACARLWADVARGSRTEVFAVDYEAVSTILAETLAAEQADYAVDEAMTEQIRGLAAKLNLGARGILVYGGRRKQIIADGLDLRRAGIGVDDLRTAFAECCGFALSTPVFELRDDLVSMRLCTARRFAVETVKCTASADAAEACGDSILTFESSANDCFYSLISDGMGSGREAALTARICTMFLEKMLSSGNRRETALRLLNAFVRAKGIECSATIDLMELDLISGRAAFIKSGAAPSYVRRDGNLFKLQSKTVPIGIMRALDAEQLCFDIEPGDIIVMLSDGIAQSFEESVWLLDLLSCGWDEADDLSTVAEKILAGAAQNNARPDDRSVALIRVRETA